MIAQAIDADGDGTVDINEFKHYFQRDSASQQDEPDDVQVKFIEDDPSPPGIQLQVSQQLGAFSGLASCLDGGEYPHSPETHPFVRSNTEATAGSRRDLGPHVRANSALACAS